MATVVSLLFLLPSLVAGHGYLSDPPARNLGGTKTQSCPHCGNGNGVCGDGGQWARDSDYVNFYRGSQKTYTAGSVVPVEVKITAHHKGHFEISICDRVITSAVTDAQACLDKWILERASPEEAGLTDCQPNDARGGCQPVDPRHPERFYLPPGSGTYKWYVKVPAGLVCEVCTMQWRWWSANSCIPGSDYACFKEDLRASGYNADAWGLGSSCPGGGCDRCGCGEEFRNCADITIQPGDGGTFPPTTSWSIPPTTTTTTLPGSVCMRNEDCVANAWCRNDAYISWCQANSATCPSPQCIFGVPGGTTPTTTWTEATTASTTTLSTTTSTMTTTASVTTTTVLSSCKAAPGSSQYGATDERCQTACDMLKFGEFPCAGILCTCPTEFLAEIRPAK
mmetsp:Transcript_24412/g.44236  ORF Transcript_24412/g.44236 Transcript_24412/m.44236 type:complete len:395 (-) Transcript_24412:171-1355(-)|eukprot:CAMPEP_0197661730 /NCGR_PEP_ID=MMETSP1338-20131121/51629_1 /TAXON_ID=43686 ORGANISM="Pelagodinium beii, Strain RCC1491" /NCGR_SAMPLE_ID=MMETSP1338 /ASSEMBLY_ACC=CAM_ASM_000754 /LENGTH=394 /DNA_ID=CAMNT_0043239337 /DNA_START=43 /DNA_END=1227 /DNA_ORIENTATION=+